jgi:hypothetical protein
MSALADCVEQNVTTIINDESTNGHERAIDTLYVALMNATQHSQHSMDAGTETVGGLALDPHSAARCLVDCKRTAALMRGLHAAITDQRQRLKRTLRVIDAGCGPLAGTSLPLLLLHGDVELLAIDIHEKSLIDVMKIATQLGVSNRVRTQVANLLHYTVSNDPDIGISETMFPGLLNEPQAHVTAHIAPQLRPDALWLPEQIDISASLGQPQKTTEQVLGHVCRLDRWIKTAAVQAGARTSLTLPSRFEPSNLYLQTEVTVYKKATIRRGESDITLPVLVAEFEVGEAMKIDLSYPFGGSPADVIIDWSS